MLAQASSRNTNASHILLKIAQFLFENHGYHRSPFEKNPNHLCQFTLIACLSGPALQAGISHVDTPSPPKSSTNLETFTSNPQQPTLFISRGYNKNDDKTSRCNRYNKWMKLRS